MAKITQVDFPPREIVTYTKETQTPVMTQPKEGEWLTCYYLSYFSFIIIMMTDWIGTSTCDLETVR